MHQIHQVKDQFYDEAGDPGKFASSKITENFTIFWFWSRLLSKAKWMDGLKPDACWFSFQLRIQVWFEKERYTGENKHCQEYEPLSNLFLIISVITNF